MMRKWFRKKRIGGSLDPDEILVDSVSTLGDGGRADSRLEHPFEKLSLVFFLCLAAAGILYLMSRAAVLQVVRGDEFFAKSQENRFFVRPIFPSRGIVADRDGKPLVENIPSFGVIFDRELFSQKRGDLEKLIGDLGLFLGKGPDYFFELGFPPDYNAAKLPGRIIIEGDIPSERVFSLVSVLEDYPGLEIFESYRRQYKAPFALSHLLGFVGKISADDLKENPELRNDDTIGKSGIEAFYDEILRGKGGKKIVEVDARGMESRVRLVEEPEAGPELYLNIDGGLQSIAYEMLARYTGGLKGASVVAVDPRDGAIRALVSYPGFDANSFGASLSKEEFRRVTENPLRPFFNRAVSGEFPSGSVIKPLIAAAALQEKLIDPLKKIYDEGFIEIPNPYKPGEKSVFVDWRKQGWINFYDAIAFSANVYFYMVGGGYHDQPGLGIERIKKYAESFGLGSKLGIDLPGERSGLIPDPSLKPKLEPQNPSWRIGDTYNVSIGQGGVKVTPLQMAMLTAAIVNGGKLYKPRILSEVKKSDGEMRQKFDPVLIRDHLIDEANLLEVAKGMRGTVTYGTAKLLGSVGVPVAAKTGTAQAGSGLPHAWVTAAAPAENPELVIVVMVEHAGEGSTVAVPIMRDILQWYFSRPK